MICPKTIDISMSPSNQGIPQRSPQNPSGKADDSTSPLEELNPNRIKRRIKPKVNREPQPFPMQTACHTPRPEIKSHSPERARSGPAPFPMPLPSQIHSQSKSSSSQSRTPSPSKTKNVSGKDNTTGRIPQRFPLDTTSSNVLQGIYGEEDNGEDELALTDDDAKSIQAYGGPRPFPMSTSQLDPETIDEASGSKRCADNGTEQRANKRSRP
jgi:hypothetical protein